MREDTGGASGAPPGEDAADLRDQLAAARAGLDAAERRADAAHARERALCGELQHRVRNMLAVVRSIFARTVAAGGELADVADHFTGRLNVLARYQLLRGVGTGAGIDFETMVHDELQSVHASGDPRVTCEGPEVTVPADIAQLLGLALHELATNSIKFGMLAMPPERGTLTVVWHMATDGFHLAWRERGMTVMRATPLRSGFGREFIEQALPYQLGASALLEIGGGSVSCDIRVPTWDSECPDSAERVVL